LSCKKTKKNIMPKINSTIHSKSDESTFEICSL
jgi:hypothetical protein